MYVVIDESLRIDVVKSSFDQLGCALTHLSRKLVWRLRECAADVMDETHLTLQTHHGGLHDRDQFAPAAVAQSVNVGSHDRERSP